MKSIFYALVLACAPVALTAQDWTLRKGQIPLTHGELQDFGIRGGTGPLRGGKTRYSFNPKPVDALAPRQDVRLGQFELLPDGRVCIGSSGAVRDCDFYMREGELRFQLGETRGRTPFRLELGVKQ